MKKLIIVLLLLTLTACDMSVEVETISRDGITSTTRFTKSECKLEHIITSETIPSENATMTYYCNSVKETKDKITYEIDNATLV